MLWRSLRLAPRLCLSLTLSVSLSLSLSLCLPMRAGDILLEGLLSIWVEGVGVSSNVEFISAFGRRLGDVLMWSSEHFGIYVRVLGFF